MKKGMQAYIDQYENTAASESEQTIEAFVKEAEAKGEPLQESGVVQQCVERDLRMSIPPQLFSAMSGIMNMMTQLEEDKEEGYERPNESQKDIRNHHESLNHSGSR